MKKKESILVKRRRAFAKWVYKKQDDRELAGFCMAWFNSREIKRILENEGIKVK